MLPKQENKTDFDGYITLVLSALLVAATAGISYLYYLKEIFQTARLTPSRCNDDVMLCVLGKKLINNKPDNEYIARLERACSTLMASDKTQVMLLGGKTGKAEISEALAGKDYLLTNNIDENRIYLEEASRNTLENIKNARSLLKKKNKEIVIVSNRYHLARVKKMTQGFGINAEICAAENNLDYSLVSIAKLLMETFHMHWYMTGKHYAHLTNNKRMLDRIS